MPRPARLRGSAKALALALHLKQGFRGQIDQGEEDVS